MGLYVPFDIDLSLDLMNFKFSKKHQKNWKFKMIIVLSFLKTSSIKLKRQ